MSKGDWIWFWGIIALAAWWIYQQSKKTPTETFVYDTFEDIAEDELESALAFY